MKVKRSYTGAFLAPVLGRRENKRKKGVQAAERPPPTHLFLTTVTPVSDEHPYQADREAAKSRGHMFTVATKEKRGARWIDGRTKIGDLHVAMLHAKTVQAYEVGIFVQGGFLYWTSAHPEVFNSTVINMRISRKDV